MLYEGQALTAKQGASGAKAAAILAQGVAVSARNAASSAASATSDHLTNATADAEAQAH